MRSWKKINICEVFVVVLILRDHLLQEEEGDRRETAVFQEEPSRTVFPPDIHLVGEYIQVLSQFHKITAQRGLINRNTYPKQDLVCVQLLSNFILQYDLLLMHNFACKEINYLCNLGHLQKVLLGAIRRQYVERLRALQTKTEAKPRRDDRVEHLSWTGKSDHNGWIEWDSKNKMEPEGEAGRKKKMPPVNTGYELFTHKAKH